jgi:hypothetical protein
MAAMKSALVTVFAVGVDASSPTGQATCKCLGSKAKYGVKEFDCNATEYPWGVDGKCVNATAAPVPGPYPADYGDSCKKHVEPGTSDCFDLTKSPPTEKPIAEQKAWCNDAWCYVDECACDASDATYSFWFKPIKMVYSYQTCGASDKFTTNQEGGVVGNSECVGGSTTGTTGTTGTSSSSGTTGTTGTAAGTTTTGSAASTDDASNAQMVGKALVTPIMLLAMLFSQLQ